MNHLATLSIYPAPVLVTAAGERAAYRFFEFFTAQIRNPNTRRAYAKAVGDFCAWMEARGLPSIAAVGMPHVRPLRMRLRDQGIVTGMMWFRVRQAADKGLLKSRRNFSAVEGPKFGLCIETASHLPSQHILDPDIDLITA